MHGLGPTARCRTGNAHHDTKRYRTCRCSRSPARISFADARVVHVSVSVRLLKAACSFVVLNFRSRRRAAIEGDQASARRYA